MPKRSRSDAAASDAAPTGPPLTVAIEENSSARETMLRKVATRGVVATIPLIWEV